MECVIIACLIHILGVNWLWSLFSLLFITYRTGKGDLFSILGFLPRVNSMGDIACIAGISCGIAKNHIFSFIGIAYGRANNIESFIGIAYGDASDEIYSFLGIDCGKAKNCIVTSFGFAGGTAKNGTASFAGFSFMFDRGNAINYETFKNFF